MNGDDQNEDTHASGLGGDGAYEPGRPGVRRFWPWHRPRKQWVREYQWAAEIEQMLAERSGGAKELSYLGLPGDELLDLRFLHSRICAPRQLPLRFFGFNSAAAKTRESEVELNTSLHEVRSLPGVDPLSQVIHDDFTLLAVESSIARDRTRHTTFDVVNLDLCDGFGEHPPSTMSPNYYDAMNWLLSCQSRRSEPWLFLLTTRTDREKVDAATLKRLTDGFVQNLADCEFFREAAAARLAVSDASHIDGCLGSPAYLQLLLCSICKWFLKMSLGHHPRTSVSVRSVVGYRVVEDAAHQDMVSIAIRFSPIVGPTVDDFGLSLQSTPVPDECSMAVDALEKVCACQDVDDLLRRDAELHRKMVDETALLLKTARFDDEAYRASPYSQLPATT